MRKFNKLQQPSSKIRHRFPSTAAKSHRDFALTVNHSRAVTRSLAHYAETTEARISVMEEKFVTYKKENHLADFSFKICGCCLDIETPRTRFLGPSIMAWACCVMVWLTLTSVLSTIKAAYLPVGCNNGTRGIYAQNLT